MTSTESKIAVLLTVFNRKEKTLQCLYNIFSQELPEKCSVNVFMTDDGCTDGTPQEVKNAYPQVTIVKGSGSLFWNRGMIAAWKCAVQTAKYDFFLWVNDDTFLYENCISILLKESLLKSHKAVIVGATCDTKTKSKTTYSGYLVRERLKINGSLQKCDYFNGNIVLVPSSVFEKIGMLDSYYHHSVGDFDYGCRLIDAGLESYISSSFLGECDRHNKMPRWVDPNYSLSQRLNNFFSPLGAAPKDNFHYNLKKWGLWCALKHIVRTFLNCLFPFIFLKRNLSDPFYFE